MANVAKVVDGTEAQVAALSSRLRELATEIPIGAEGLAQIAAAGGQLGVPIEKLGLSRARPISTLCRRIPQTSVSRMRR